MDLLASLQPYPRASLIPHQAATHHVGLPAVELAIWPNYFLA
jgi:hypothetical protein